VRRCSGANDKEVQQRKRDENQFGSRGRAGGIPSLRGGPVAGTPAAARRAQPVATHNAPLEAKQENEEAPSHRFGKPCRTCGAAVTLSAAPKHRGISRHNEPVPERDRETKMCLQRMDCGRSGPYGPYDPVFGSLVSHATSVRNPITQIAVPAI
jgi:hypothetical protein